MIIKISIQLGKLSKQNIGTLILHVRTFHSFASILSENGIQTTNPNQTKSNNIEPMAIAMTVSLLLIRSHFWFRQLAILMCAFVKYTQFYKWFAFISNLIGLLMVLSSFFSSWRWKWDFEQFYVYFVHLSIITSSIQHFYWVHNAAMHKCAHGIHLSFVFGDQVMLVSPVSDIKRKAPRKPNVDLSNIRRN